MKIQKYQLIERCTQDDYSPGTPRPILQQVYFDGEALRVCDGFKAVVIHPTDVDKNDKPGFISMSTNPVNTEGWNGKYVNPLIEARKAERGSDTITMTVDNSGVSTSAGRFRSDVFDKSTYPDFTPNTPKDPGYLFTLDIAHLLDLADTLLDMSNKKGGRRHTGEALEFYWSQTHPNSVMVKPMVEKGSDNKDYGVLMGMQSEQVPMSGVLSPRASGVDNADSDLPSREEYQRTLAGHADVLIERNELRARVAELEAQAKQQRGQWCDPVTTNELFGTFIKWMVEEYEYWPAHNAHDMEVVELIELIRDSLDNDDMLDGDERIEQQALQYFINVYDLISQNWNTDN